jgi:hypothetical protein
MILNAGFTALVARVRLLQTPRHAQGKALQDGGVCSEQTIRRPHQLCAT